MRQGVLSRLRTGRRGKAYHLIVYCVFFHTACGPASEKTEPAGSDDSFVDGRILVLSPNSGASYTGSPPPVILLAEPPLTESDLPNLSARIGDVDISDRLALSGTSLTASGISDVLTDGTNQLRVTLGDETHQVTFSYQRCEKPPCDTPAPYIAGPKTVTALAQEQLWGTGFGGPGDHRVLHVDGHAIEIPGGHFGEDWAMFIAPPGVEEVEVVFEVNGRKSNAVTIQVEPAPALVRPAEEVLADFAKGMSALDAMVRDLPTLNSGNPELDTLVAETRLELGGALTEGLAQFESKLAAIPAEGRETLAQFLEMGTLDTLFNTWAEQAVSTSKADASGGVITIEGQCERTILRSYKLISYLTLVLDWLKTFTLAVTFLALIWPIAITWIPALLGTLLSVTLLLGLVRLFIVSVLPDVTGTELTLPEVVQHDEEVDLKARVLFTYDPAVKGLGIANWAAESALGIVLGGAAMKVKYPDIIAEILGLSLEKTMALAKFCAKEIKSDTAPQGVWVDADPTMIGFDAKWVQLKAHEDSAACAAIASWKEDAPCDIKDHWKTGWNLTPSGPGDLIWSKTLAEGDVRTGDLVIEGEYDNAEYGEWLEKFGSENSCDKMVECWEIFQETDCNPGLGSLSCNAMSLGECPTNNDFDLALQHCTACE